MDLYLFLPCRIRRGADLRPHFALCPDLISHPEQWRVELTELLLDAPLTPFHLLAVGGHVSADQSTNEACAG